MKYKYSKEEDSPERQCPYCGQDLDSENKKLLSKLKKLSSSVEDKKECNHKPVRSISGGSDCNSYICCEKCGAIPYPQPIPSLLNDIEIIGEITITDDSTVNDVTVNWITKTLKRQNSLIKNQRILTEVIKSLLIK